MSTPKSFTMVFLYDKMAASLPVAQALKEKNIDVHVAQNAGELIQFIAMKNVDLVGLSANHASSKSLIQVLREKTSVKILIFGEDKSQGTVDRVDTLDGDYKVLGVATAYNIWMKIASMVKNKMKESENNGNILYSGGAAATVKQEATITVKSTKEAKFSKGEGTSAFGKKKKDKNKKQSSDLEDKNDVINFQQQSGDAAPGEKSSDLLFFKKESGEGKKSKKKKSFGKEPEVSSSSQESTAEESFLDQKQAKQGGDAVIEKAVPNMELDEVSRQAEESGEDLGTILEVGMQEPKTGMGELSAPKFNKNRNKKSSKQAEGSRNEPPEVPFKDQVLAAVSGTFVSNDESREEFGTVNRITVVPVDKEQGRGFLIFCTIDNQFMGSSGPAFEDFKSSLLNKMASHDSVDFGDVYNIETEEIDIQNLIQNSSDFHVIVADPKSQKQVLICFVAKENIYPDTNRSNDTDMMMVELDVIPAQTPINFNLFLHFSRNNRMIPYLRRGGELTVEQLKRLAERGVQSVYIPEDERKALYSFFISQTIHQDIRPAKKAA
jgi:hypothetical protein